MPILNAGARELLETLQTRGLRLALICNTGRTPGKMLRLVLERLGLAPYLSVLSFSDEVGLRKPHPEIFHRTLSALGASPAEVQALGDGTQMRDFVYVKDCVDAMIWLMEHPEVDGLFNLGTGKAQTWLELMGALYAAVGHEMEVEWKDTPEDIRDKYQYFTQAEMGRLRAAGYDTPFRTVEEGVADYVKQHLATEDPYR